MRRNRTVYAINRYYSPDTGRFTTHDPLTELDRPERLNQPQGLNLYPYVMGGPTRYTDPDGLDWGRSKKADANNNHEIKWFPDAVDSDYETKPVGWIFYDNVQKISRMCGAGGRFIDLDFAGYPIPPPPAEPGETGSAKPWKPLEFNKAGGSSVSCTSGFSGAPQVLGPPTEGDKAIAESAAYFGKFSLAIAKTPVRWVESGVELWTELDRNPLKTLAGLGVQAFNGATLHTTYWGPRIVSERGRDEMYDDALTWLGDPDNLGNIAGDVVFGAGIGRVMGAGSAAPRPMTVNMLESKPFDPATRALRLEAEGAVQEWMAQNPKAKPGALVGAYDPQTGAVVVVPSGPPPSTVTGTGMNNLANRLGGVGTETECGNLVLGCAEQQAAEQLSYIRLRFGLDTSLSDIRRFRFTEPIRPRRVILQPVCPNCQFFFRRNQFPSGTAFE